jgi:phenylalanyl-tRNA synthetase beta chain
MRALLSWIREFTPIEAAPADIADALNQLGLEVEAIDEPGRDINGVIVARILDVLPHPDADRIRLADVEFGDGELRVVCGAPNIEPGMVVPFARVGAVLPGDFKIERRKIRGIVSEGMLCSARELGLGDDHSGIVALPPNTPLGSDVREALGLDDVVFELAITPDRPDAMGITGIARELAAHFALPFTVEEHEPAPVVDVSGDSRVVVEATDRCPRFVGLVATVTMGESPAWMQRRLTLAGMRPISNVVDVTNYVMLERCRPLHAFDLGRLAGRGIVVRLARDGEKMTTLDDVERTLTPEDLLICDAERSPQAIAGIMGGAAAEVSNATTEILLESAYFEPFGIAKTAKRLGLRSEASARFERGIDPNGAGTGAARAMELFEQVAAAVPAAGAIDVYPQPTERPRITIRTARVNQLLGTALTDSQVADELRPLGVDVVDGVATAPTFRPDLEREIDLVEEVARRVGLSNITRTIPASPEKIGGLTPQQRDRRTASDVLVGAGYDEVFTLPLLAQADLVAHGDLTTGIVEVANPLRAEESILRPSLLPGLVRAAAHNAAHGLPDVALFEQGTVFGAPAEGDTLPREVHALGALRAGSVRRAPYEPDRGVSVHDAAAPLWALIDELRVAAFEIGPATASHVGFRRGCVAALTIDNGTVVGVIGELDTTPAACAFELDLDALCAATRLDRTFAPVSRFPASTIDLAFVVHTDVLAAELQSVLRATAPNLIEEVRLFDVFRSGTLGAHKVSLAFSMRFRAPDRTLTDDEVGRLRKQAIDAAMHAFPGAELRG